MIMLKQIRIWKTSEYNYSPIMSACFKTEMGC